MAFQNIVAIFKINSIDLSFCFFFVFICRASRICSRSLLISSAIIVVFSTRIFRNLDLGIEWLLICKAMELESLRCIVSRLERVVVIRPTCALFSLETQSSKGHLNVCPIRNFGGGGSIFRNNLVGGFKFVVVNDKSYFLVRSVGRTVFWIWSFNICSSIL